MKRAGKELESPAKILLRLRINGEIREVASELNKTLLEVLRECGTCAVLVNGKSVLSCLMLGLEAVGVEIVTVEGMMQDGRPHPL